MGYKYISKKQPTDTDKVFLNYSGTLLIWSTPGNKNLTVLTVLYGHIKGVL